MSEVTRSVEATSARAAARAARKRVSQPVGWWGAVLFVATEATLFGTLISSYFYLRFRTSPWPPAGIEPPDMTAPLILTGVLVATTVPILAASRAARAGRTVPTWSLVLAALVVQAGYFGVQVHLFLRDLDEMPAGDSSYAAIYHTLLGTHHLHVGVGLLLNAWVLVRLLGGLTNYRVLTVRVVAVYWCFVNALAVAVVFTQLYPSL